MIFNFNSHLFHIFTLFCLNFLLPSLVSLILLFCWFGIKLYKNEDNAVLIITHSTKILESLDVDYVHILYNGKIIKTGDKTLANEIEKEGYSKYINEN